MDKAPENYSGVSLYTDFKQVLKFFRVVDSDVLDETDKSLLTYDLFVKEIDKGTTPEEITEAITTHISGPDKKEERGGSKSFDFNQDHGLLMAAFLQVYNIDLKTASIHWWDFMELFGALPEGTHLMKVIEIRNKPIPKKGDRKYINGIRKLKRIYSLEKPEDRSAQVQDSISRMMGEIGR